MRTIDSTAVRRMFYLKIAFWLFLVIFAGRFVIKDALPYFGFTEEIFGRWWEMKWWLAGHITGGMIALALGPLQFWPTFRNRYLNLHRWIGRIYIIAIVVASLSSAVLIFTTAAAISWAWSLALGGLAFAWISTVSMAYVAIRKRRINMHKEWMIRSYVVTFGFVLFRWASELSIIADTPFIERGPAVGWACWAIPLFITEMILSWYRDKK